MSLTRRQTIRGTADALEKALNRLLADGLLHEVWHMGVTDNADDIELGLELLRIGQPTIPRMKYMVLSTYGMRIDNEETELRKAGKYMATKFRQPLFGDKEKAVAIIEIAN